MRSNQQHCAGITSLTASQTIQTTSKSLQSSLQKGIKHKQQGIPTKAKTKLHIIVTLPTFLLVVFSVFVLH
jgi:hypothetical protein